MKKSEEMKMQRLSEKKNLNNNEEIELNVLWDKYFDDREKELSK